MNTAREHTLEDHKLWTLISEAWKALADLFEPTVGEKIRGSRLTRRMWSLLLSALTCEPEAINTAELLVRNPYTSAEEFQDRLAEGTQLGYLVESEPGSYRLSEAGRNETESLITVARDAMNRFDPLPVSDSARLARLLEKLVIASLNTPPPPEPWSIRSSFKLMPEKEPPMPFIEQAITCLFAYRDDSHLAAWQFASISATGLETLSLIWRNEASSYDEVCEKLSRRGQPCETYERAIAELRDRNFIEGPDSNLMVTNDGRLFRNEVESDTDRLFFAPWKTLTDREKTDMAGLLIRMKEELESQTP